MDVTDLSGKLALVTGAASGIGRESALAFAGRGADVAICDVDEAGLKETEAAVRALGRDALARRVDVADPDQVRAFAEVVHARVPAVDILMNNAGVGLGAGFLDTSLEDWSWILGINQLGVIHGCHFFLPRMVEHGGPRHVVNVSSLAGYMATEALAAYTMTKYAVLGLSESLLMELKPHGIGVTAVCPGVINTPIVQTTRLRGRNDTEDARKRMVDAYARRGYGPDRVARAILRAIQRERAIAPVSPEAWIVYGLKRLSPSLVHRLIAWGEARGRRALGEASATKS